MFRILFNIQLAGNASGNWITPAQQISSPQQRRSSANLAPPQQVASPTQRNRSFSMSKKGLVGPSDGSNIDTGADVVVVGDETSAHNGGSGAGWTAAAQHRIRIPDYIDSFLIDRKTLLTTKVCGAMCVVVLCGVFNPLECLTTVCIFWRIVIVHSLIGERLCDPILTNFPTQEWSCAVLFAHLNAQVVFKIINLLLMEKSLIIYGKNPGIVTTITLAVINLISPFIWEGNCGS